MNNQEMTLREHRIKKALSMRALVREVRMNGGRLSTQTLVSLESGKPGKMQSFRVIANALNCEPTDITEYQNIIRENESLASTP